MFAFQSNLKELDRFLGPFPYDSWKKWVSLTNKISKTTISRLEPTLDGKIRAVSEFIPQGKRRENPQELPELKAKPGTNIAYTSVPTERFPENSTPEEITKHSMDESHRLELYLKAFEKLYEDKVSTSMARIDLETEALAELQFAFVCFLIGRNYDSFEHWKCLLSLFCGCDEALNKRPSFFLALMADLHFQVREVPDDFFVDIVAGNNFLVVALTRFFEAVKSNEAVSKELKSRAEKFQKNLTKKFNWDFDLELEEDQPVVVEMPE